MAKAEDLPVADGGYQLTPAPDRLSQMTPKELRSVRGVCVENEFGALRFRQPVSLFQKRLSESVAIAQDSVEIFEEEWLGRRCELRLRNFSGYGGAREAVRRKIERKMRKWAQINKMSIVHFCELTGDLTVDLCF